MIVEALKSLGITTEFLVDPDATTEEQYLKSYKDLTNQNRFFDWSIVSVKISELESAEPLRLLRIERNRLLQETDWTQNRDVILSNDSDWQTYRQSLRDLPSTSSPELDEQGNLTNVTWPTKPE